MKRKYSVCHTAEGAIYGYIYLTPEEAAIVEYATNKDNWFDRGICDGGYGGSFTIVDATIEDWS